MSTPRHLLLVSAAATTLVAAVHAQTAPSSSTQVLGTPIRSAQTGISEVAREFIEDAAHAGHAEVEAARLALSKSADPDVRSFAQRMIDDHTRLNTQLQQIARARGLQPPSEPSLAQQGRLSLLRVSDGPDFDRRYVEDFGVRAHRDTIERFGEAASRIQDAQLNKVAQEALPTLRQHLQVARTLQARTDPAAAAVRTPATSDTASADEDLRNAREEITEAVQVVQRMKRDPGLLALLERAKAVFILTDYGRAGFGIGAQGGEGVLVTRQGERFSNPVFYNLGGVSIGAQAGVAGGEVAMLLMTDRAVENFRSGRKFSVHADADLTIVDYARRAQVSAGKVEDIVVWSDTQGAYAGASIGITDVVVDNDANRAYYQHDTVTPRQILRGDIVNPQHNVLDRVLRA